MDVKYKVRFFAEYMITIDVEADQNTTPEEIVKEARSKADLHSEVDNGRSVFTGYIQDIVVDKYDAYGNYRGTMPKTQMLSLLDKEN